MSFSPPTGKPATPPAPPNALPSPGRRLLGIVGWGVVVVAVLGAAWGAGKGESKLPQVNVTLGTIQGHSATQALKKLATLLPQSVRKARYSVRWNEAASGKTVSCALLYDRDEKTLDLYRGNDTQNGGLMWRDGYNEVNDAEIIVASKSKEGFERLDDLGATRSPQPIAGKTQL